MIRFFVYNIQPSPQRDIARDDKFFDYTRQGALLERSQSIQSDRSHAIAAALCKETDISPDNIREILFAGDIA